VNIWLLRLAIAVFDNPKALLKPCSESRQGIGSAFIVIFNNLLLQALVFYYLTDVLAALL